MKSDPTLSKTQYIKGLQCPLALWFYRNRKDLRPEIDAATRMRFDAGLEVGALAERYFGHGAKVAENYWEVQKAVQSTKQLIAEGNETIFEATALHPTNGVYSRIDIFRKVAQEDKWDLIEVKSSTGEKDYHIDDVAFQYYVFKGAGYEINNCYLMLVNNKYVREGEIDTSGLFKLVNITEEVLANQANMDNKCLELCNIVEQLNEPIVAIGSRCFSPFECEYKDHCWRKVPEYSIYDIFPITKVDQVFAKTKSFHVSDIPSDLLPNGYKAIDVNCHKEKTEHIERKKLKGFLDALKHPLYFLDYETLMYPVPLYEGTRPYQQIPFQFSLHLQAAPGETPRHFSYIHKQKNDPRPSFLERLLALCGKLGSIVVYNKTFEIQRNEELATDFPEFAEELRAINGRIIDLMEPFQKRWLYKPNQLSSYSIKHVLPAYVSDLSYKNMEIASGEGAATSYTRFVNGMLPPDETEKLWSALDRYGEMDTNAMVRLLDVMQNLVT